VPAPVAVDVAAEVKPCSNFNSISPDIIHLIEFILAYGHAAVFEFST
jgi:hypothetical protein